MKGGEEGNQKYLCYFWRPLHGTSSKEAARTKTLLKDLSHYHEKRGVYYGPRLIREKQSFDRYPAGSHRSKGQE